MVLKKSVPSLSSITVNYLHFALVSMEPKIFDNFLKKTYLDNSSVTL